MRAVHVSLVPLVEKLNPDRDFLLELLRALLFILKYSVLWVVCICYRRT
jgi:hypothetical protein